MTVETCNTDGTGRTMRVVLVDDDADDRALIREAIHDAGLTVTLDEVAGAEALLGYLNDALAAKRLPDLILLDILMPGKNGIQALREVKFHPVLKRIPVIMFTVDGQGESIESAYSIGANAYVRKTHDRAELAGIMRMLPTFWGERRG